MCVEENMTNEISSRCGIRCDQCFILRANVEKRDRRAEICATWNKLGIGTFDPAVIICDGCLSEGKCLSAGAGKTRPCVIKKGIPHCGYCDDYPCDDFNEHEPDPVEFYKEMESRGTNWTSEDDKMMEPYNPKSVIDDWRKNNGFSK